MFNDLVWKSEPEYVNLLIVVTSVVLQAIFTAIIINHSIRAIITVGSQ